MKCTSLLWLILLSVVSVAAISQAEPGDEPRRGPPQREDGGGPPPPRPPKPPIETALDADRDGEISADEIAGASSALLKLDKNGDGKLTPEEYRPRRPGGGPRDRDRAQGDRRPRRSSADDSQGSPPRKKDGDKDAGKEGRPKDSDDKQGRDNDKDKAAGDKAAGDKDRE